MDARKTQQTQSVSKKIQKPFETVLVHAPNWVGDHVMAFPFYLALEELFPNANKILLARPWVKSLLPKNIFSQVFPVSKKNFPWAELAQLRKNPPDISFTLSPSFRSVWNLLLANANLRIGYPTGDRFLLLKTKQYKIPPLNIKEHRALSYIRLLTPFLPQSVSAVELFADKIKKTYPLQTVEESPFPLDMQNLKKNKYWVVAPGSSAVSKIYPTEYHAQIIASSLLSNRIEQFVLIGSPKEEQQAQEIFAYLQQNYNEAALAKILPNIVNLCGKTDLSQLLTIMKNSLGVTANDSGIAHMAYLTNSKLVTFIGMARIEETLTLAQQKIVLKKNLDCIGCMKHLCPRKANPNECLTTIQPQEVMDAMKTFL